MKRLVILDCGSVDSPAIFGSQMHAIAKDEKAAEHFRLDVRVVQVDTQVSIRRPGMPRLL